MATPQSRIRPNKLSFHFFLFVQEYVDEAAFEAHLASEHVKRMLARVLPLLASPPDLRRYRLLSAP